MKTIDTPRQRTSKKSTGFLGKAHADRARIKIQSSLIVTRFIQFFEGKIKLTKEQIRVGEVLLKKTVPDLQSVELTGDGDTGIILNVLRFAEQKMKEEMGDETEGTEGI